MLFVKLWQFDLADRAQIMIDINRIGSIADATRPGVRATPLFRDAREDVRIEAWDAGAAISLPTAGGAEILVLEGSCREGGDELRRHSWLRLPGDDDAAIEVGAVGARVWIKSGHLRFAAPPAIAAAH